MEKNLLCCKILKWNGIMTSGLQNQTLTSFSRENIHLFPGHRTIHYCKLWPCQHMGFSQSGSGQQKLVSKLYWSPVFGRSFDIPAFPAWCIKGAWADYKLKPEIALTKLISKDSTYIIELISWSTCLTFKMNRMNVFECPSERDTEKEISHRYENIKHTPTGEKGKKTQECEFI